jgi:hypothetical protein
MSLIKCSLRYLLLILLLAAIVVTAIVTKDAWLPLLNPNAAGNKIDRLPPDDRMAREAAVHGIQAFYAFDSQTGKDAWLETLCQVTSQAGCKLTGLGANRIWESLGDQPFSYVAEVDILEKVSDRPATAANGKSSQVWKTVITLNQPLPGSETITDTTYALVVTEDGQWRFERFLTAPESAQFDNEAVK